MLHSWMEDFFIQIPSTPDILTFCVRLFRLVLYTLPFTLPGGAGGRLQEVLGITKKKTPLNPKHRRHMYEYFVLPSCTNALRSCFQNYASIMGWKGSWVDCGTVYRSGFVFQRCLQTIIKATAFFLPSRMPCVCLHILFCLQSLLLAAHLHDW